MSLLPAIKDYYAILQNVEYPSIYIPLQTVIKETPAYLFVTLKYICSYFFTFQWLPNFSYFPNLVTEIEFSILNETSILGNSKSTILTFLEIPTVVNNKLFLGFLNSFFLSLPISSGYFLTVRRLLFYGINTGSISALGTIMGQLCFASCILLGFRSIIITWFSFPILHFILTVFIIFNLFREVVILNFANKYLEQTKTKFIKFFCINFILSWTEQSSIFRYFGNLTFSPEPNVLETVFSNTEFDSFILTAYYLLGLFLGSFFFTGLFGFLLIRFHRYLTKHFYARWLRVFNTYSKVIIATSFCAVNPLSYYGCDYLLSGPAGNLYQDPGFFNNWLSFSTLIERRVSPISEYVPNHTHGLDPGPFDKGKHLRHWYSTLAFETQRMTDRIPSIVFRAYEHRYFRVKRKSKFVRLVRGQLRRFRPNSRFSQKYKIEKTKNNIFYTNLYFNNSFKKKKQNLLFLRKKIKEKQYKITKFILKLLLGKHVVRKASNFLEKKKEKYKKKNKEKMVSEDRLYWFLPRESSLKNNKSKKRNIFRKDNKKYKNDRSFDFSNVVYNYQINAFMKNNSVSFLEAYMKACVKAGTKVVEPLINNKEKENEIKKFKIKVKGEERRQYKEIQIPKTSYNVYKFKLEGAYSDFAALAHPIFLKAVKKNKRNRVLKLRDRLPALESHNTSFYPERKSLKYSKHLVSYYKTRSQLTFDKLFTFFGGKGWTKHQFDLFYQNQPTFQLLTADEEKRLFEKRLVLNNYYQSFRYYNKLPFVIEFKGFQNLSKSQVNKVFNHQFKGTNSLVRSYFAITERKKTALNLKYQAHADILLYKKSVLKFDQPLYINKDLYSDKKYKPFHEELSFKKKYQNIFLEISNPIPFYAGWDQTLQKFVLTNRLYPRELAGHVVFSPKVLIPKEDKEYEKIVDKFESSNFKETIEFTTWPITRPTLNIAFSKIGCSLLSEHLGSMNMATNLRNPRTEHTKEELYDRIDVRGITQSKPRPFLPSHFTLYQIRNSLRSEARYKYLFRKRRTKPIYVKFNHPSVISTNKGSFAWPGNPSLEFFELDEFVEDFVFKSKRTSKRMLRKVKRVLLEFNILNLFPPYKN